MGLRLQVNTSNGPWVPCPKGATGLNDQSGSVEWGPGAGTLLPGTVRGFGWNYEQFQDIGGGCKVLSSLGQVWSLLPHTSLNIYRVYFKLLKDKNIVSVSLKFSRRMNSMPSDSWCSSNVCLMSE